MFFRQLLHEEKSCLSYVVGCKSRGVCVTIDAQGDSSQYLDLAKSQSMKIIGVIETHIQADHLSASAEVAKKADATLYFGPGARVGSPHEELKDNTSIQVGNRTIKVLHTPGHTPEHVSLLVDDWLALTGDTLFVGDVGRVDLVAQSETSDDEAKAKAAILYDSVQKLLALPDWTEIYPGHYAGSACGKGMDSKPSSTIGRERRHNPVLGLEKEKFVQYLLENMPPPPPNFLQIKKSNQSRA